MKNCPKCKSVSFHKAGFRAEKQRYMCNECGYHFSQDKTKEYSPEIKSKAIQLYLSGMSLRGVGKFLGVSNVAVLYWVRKYASSLPEPEPAKHVETVEIDEMCITLGQKKLKFGSGSLFVLSHEKSSGMSWVVVER